MYDLGEWWSKECPSAQGAGTGKYYMEAPAQQRRCNLASFRCQKEKAILMLSPATRMDLEIGPPALNAADSDYKIPPRISPPPKCGGRGYRASRRGRRRL